jgi:Na+/H+ antiporter NhaD/arsenite permease-like protein
MGYLFGVPFTWTFGLWKPWVFVNLLVLLIYFVVDSIYFSRESAGKLTKETEPAGPGHFFGTQNLVLLLAVILTVALVPKAPHREILLVSYMAISFLTTRKAIHKKNHFSFFPVIEVAVLFFGIFLTVVPAVLLLRSTGPELGLTTSRQFFWSTGILSAFLDNTPTYVVFFNLAQSLKVSNEIVGMSVELLKAISLGAVFFGAMTYIGNAPNFMVKAIAEERGIKMPSFFGYMIYSVLVLIPIFIVVTYLWF